MKASLNNTTFFSIGENELILTNLLQDDLMKYLDLLKDFSKRYTVIIVSYDTPFGPGYKRELSYKLMSLGLEIDLFGKFRASYVAVIDCGKTIFEKISDGNAIRYKEILCSCDVEAVSTGYNSNDWITCAKINGKDQLVKSRGLNFIVFDKVTGFILDSVGFDTYSEGYPSMRKSDLVDFINRITEEKQVKFVCCKFPKFPEQNLTQYEQLLMNNSNINTALYNYYDRNGVEEVTTIPKSYYDVNNVRRFLDYKSDLLNTHGGHRVTTNQPSGRNRTIYMVGGCRMYGLGADDTRTIESYLQSMFNSFMPDKKIVVQNYGFMFEGLKKNEVPIIIENLPLKPGDIVVIEAATDDMKNVISIDLSNAFSITRDYETFYDTIHYTPDGNRLTAEGLFTGIKQSGFLNEEVGSKSYRITSNYGFDNTVSEELNKYKSILSEYYSEMFPEPVIGSIVMNCNPFTLGHRYLIEKALEQCDFLVIFVVQEDKSIFPFDDRLKLVDDCTADIDNKVVIPSGRFIISSLTFSEYFNKSEMQDMTIDTSLDVTVFAREIAPCLHISKRFAGEEPKDSVTRQYNETMSRILPEYGIEFIEIPRVECEDAVISASYVRKLLKKKDFEIIKKLVPSPTYDYLVKEIEALTARL